MSGRRSWLRPRRLLRIGILTIGLGAITIGPVAAAARAEATGEAPPVPTAVTPAVAPAGLDAATPLPGGSVPWAAVAAPPALGAAGGGMLQGGGGGAPQLRYYALDALGSVRVVFDAAGQVVSRADYEPFGAAVPASTTGTLPRQQYTGHERDGEVGVDYFGARMYVPALGRMPSVDPLYAGAVEEPQRWNRYAYVMNRPLTLVDPDGRDPILKIKIVENCGSTCFPVLTPSPGQPSLLGDGSGLTDSKNYFLLQYGYVPEFGSQTVGPPPSKIIAAEPLIGTGDAMGDLSFGLSTGAVIGVVSAVGEVFAAPLVKAVSSAGQALWDRITGRAAAVANEIGILRAAKNGKGNFGLGSADHAQAAKLGRAWVGDGYKVASDGRTLISGDGLRQYRPP